MIEINNSKYGCKKCDDNKSRNGQKNIDRNEGRSRKSIKNR